ncbi:MAG: sugar isomerase [Acidobacteria bacterium]|nr:sugar isomerase [Acidobacteriota bacterium]
MCCHDLNRRDFVGLAAGAGLLPGLSIGPARAAEWAADLWDPERPFLKLGRPLKVQPVLMYSLPKRREQTSWKSWGGIQTQESAAAEVNRITEELKALSTQAEFALEPLPVVKVTSVEEAARARNPQADVTIIYPATGSGAMLRAAIPEQGDAIIFVRKRSGPVYYWYEALSVRYLRPDRPQPAPANPAEAPRLSVHDVVVDERAELEWRLRALFGARNFLGARVLALGGAQGKYAAEAPRVARERFKLDIVETNYDDAAPRIRAALADRARMARAEQWARRYLSLPKTTLETDRKFVVNAFVLYGVFKELIQESGAAAFTINRCMGTILPIAETTACLTLSLLNDEGLPAFCEADFVIVPAGVLLRYISGKPVFLHNSTFPHNAVVTCAHCTGPRRMNAARYEPVRVLTHYESEYGAAPKVEIPPGQQVSFINPEYATCRWAGMRGTVESNPFYEICRSQQDVRIHGNWKKLLSEVRDSHWVMVYGDYLKEIGYAAPRIGVTWENFSDAQTPTS